MSTELDIFYVDDELVSKEQFEKLGIVEVVDLPIQKPEKASSYQRNRRLKICESCNKYISLTRQCKECLCVMPLKTRLKRAKCPLKKW